MKVESDVLIYFHYENTKRKFSDSARKTNTLAKLSFKAQVSAAFASVSILIDTYCIVPGEKSRQIGKSLAHLRRVIGTTRN
jgi:hypothetical protein